MSNKEYFKIYVAEDDPDDQLLLQSAVDDLGLDCQIVFANDGIELIEKLNDLDISKTADLPSLLLLDLNMPRKDGRETLLEVKKHSLWRSVPAVILTTSDSPADVSFCYKNGANCFITKPASYEELITLLKSLHQFWFTTAKLPMGLHTN